MKNSLKVLSALAAIAGVVYVIAAYGDKIVAWAKKLCPCCSAPEELPEEEAAAETAEKKIKPCWVTRRSKP